MSMRLIVRVLSRYTLVDAQRPRRCAVNNLMALAGRDCDGERPRAVIKLQRRCGKLPDSLNDTYSYIFIGILSHW